MYTFYGQKIKIDCKFKRHRVKYISEKSFYEHERNKKALLVLEGKIGNFESHYFPDGWPTVCLEKRKSWTKNSLKVVLSECYVVH